MWGFKILEKINLNLTIEELKNISSAFDCLTSEFGLNEEEIEIALKIDRTIKEHDKEFLIFDRAGW